MIFHRDGQAVGDFDKAWATACKAVGIVPGRQGLTFHDLRRTGLRNMTRAGVDRTVAKRISGHRTDATFERYNITDEDDLRDAVAKTTVYVESLPRERKVKAITDAK